MTPNEPILSGEEIAALMSREARADASGRGAEKARSFSFGSGNVHPGGALPALDRMNDRLAKRMRDVFEPFLRAKPRVEAEPVALRPLRDWQAEQRPFTAISLYSFRPLKGTLALTIPAEFVSRLVDCFYGGSGGPLAEPSEFTDTEERLSARIADALIAAFAEVWHEIAAIEPLLRGRETNVALAGLGNGDESMTVCRFQVIPLQGRPTAVEILFPAAALRSVEGALAAKSSMEAGARGEEWRARLGEALGDVRIEARTVLARPELSLAELMHLKVGDVIPVSIPACVPLLVEGRTVAVGSIGEQDGKAALKIDRIEPRRIAP